MNGFDNFATPDAAQVALVDDLFNFGGSTEDDGIGILNLAGVAPDAGPKREVYPPGIYDAVVDDIQPKTSKAGKKMLAFTYKCFTPEHKSFKVWDYKILEEEHFGRLVRVLQILDPQIDLTRINPSTLSRQLVDRPVRLKLKIDYYEGKASNKIDGDSGIQPAVATFQ